MTTPKNPEVAKVADELERLKRVVQVALLRIASLEKENKRLRGAVGRTSDQLGTVERRLPKR